MRGIEIDRVRAEINIFNCSDRLTWFLCGWWSKLTRFLNAGRKSLGFSISTEIDLVFVCVVDTDLISVNSTCIQFGDRQFRDRK